MANALLLVVLLASEAPATADATRFPNYTRLRADVAGSGQPSREALEGLSKSGFRTVVNLRREDEDGVKAERAIVEAQGLRYLHVPVSAASLSRADVAAVATVLADPRSGPVLLHCASGSRVGALWALVEATRGMPLEEAIAAGQQAGLKGDAMIAAVRRVAAEPSR
jgi:uncharacterized protein (TIGR01244 family)